MNERFSAREARRKRKAWGEEAKPQVSGTEEVSARECGRQLS
jgi:hypothetical protein